VHNLRSITTLVVCFAVALPLAALDELRMIPVFRHGAPFTTPYDVVAADLDGDKVNELVVCNSVGAMSLVARGGAYVIGWQAPPVGCSAMDIGDRDRDGGLDVVVAHVTRLMIFDPRGLSGPVATVTLPTHAVDVAIGNVDNDGGPEIVVISSSAAYVYDGGTLELQWTASGYGGTAVRIADIDGNDIPEIVVNGSTAAVLDAVTETQKWGYVGGFGPLWDTGNLDGDAKEEIVFHHDDEMNILSGDTFATVTWPTSGDFYTLAVDDGDGNGTNEIVGARYAVNAIAGLRSADGVELWSIPAINYGTRSILIANLDGDAVREVVSASTESYSSNSIRVFDQTTGNLEWESPKTLGPFFVATGDLDGDGRLEQVVSTGSNNVCCPAEGTIEVFDAATHVLEATIPVSSSGIAGQVAALAVAQADADPALEIVAIAGDYSHRLIVWDGMTGEHEFTSNTGSTALLAVLSVANLDGDAIDELIVGTNDSKLLVLNGASNFVQKSLQLTGQLRDAAVADLNGDSDLELVVASYYDQLTVFDTSTWAVLGQAEFSYVADLDATSAGGGTVVAGSYYYGLRVYKGATLTLDYGCGGGGFPAVTFGEIAGDTRLIAATEFGGLALYPLDAGSCPDPQPVQKLTANAIHRLEFADATGDGRKDLLVSSEGAAHVALLGLSSELRGDADGDEIITVDDIDEVTDHLLAGAAGISPSADANADERLGIEDLFRLIDHELGSGEELQP
jgi:hypothetical protein